jgi:hypothetical protein
MSSLLALVKSSDIQKIAVTAVTTVTSSNDAASRCNRNQDCAVTDGYNVPPGLESVTAVTVAETARLQKIYNDYSKVTAESAVTVKNDDSGTSKAAPVHSFAFSLKALVRFEQNPHGVVAWLAVPENHASRDPAHSYRWRACIVEEARLRVAEAEALEADHDRF